jgi:hypothetical protein
MSGKELRKVEPVLFFVTGHGPHGEEDMREGGREGRKEGSREGGREGRREEGRDGLPLPVFLGQTLANLVIKLPVTCSRSQ